MSYNALSELKSKVKTDKLEGQRRVDDLRSEEADSFLSVPGAQRKGKPSAPP